MDGFRPVSPWLSHSLWSRGVLSTLLVLLVGFWVRQFHPLSDSWSSLLFRGRPCVLVDVLFEPDQSCEARNCFVNGEVFLTQFSLSPLMVDMRIHLSSNGTGRRCLGHSQDVSLTQSVMYCPADPCSQGVLCESLGAGL